MHSVNLIISNNMSYHQIKIRNVYSQEYSNESMCMILWRAPLVGPPNLRHLIPKGEKLEDLNMENWST